MTWIIGPLCIDKLDTACVGVCPVDCIHLYKGDDPNIPKNQLLIDPPNASIVRHVSRHVRGKPSIRMKPSLKSSRSL